MQINNLTISFGEKSIYKNFSLAVNDGQTLCIMGSSGSGKTTLLKAIAGLIDYEGTIEKNGNVGYVFQNYALIPKISCEKNCLFVMNDNFKNNNNVVATQEDTENCVNKANCKSQKNAKNCVDKTNCNNHQNTCFFSKNSKFVCKIKQNIEKKKEILKNKKNIIADIFAKLAITDCLNKLPTHISGGEASRVSMARALCSGAEILLLDEPFRGLDIANKFKALSLFMAIAKSQHKTVVFVSHDIDDCLRFGDKVVVIKRIDNDGIQIVGDFDISQDKSGTNAERQLTNQTLQFSDNAVGQSLQGIKDKIFELLTNNQ
ncbi:MAG: ATP-binding cassette domain-containing protein [Clostridia bacterium]